MSTAALPAAQQVHDTQHKAASMNSAQAAPKALQAVDAAFREIDVLIWQSLSDAHKQDLVKFCVGAAISRAAFLEETLKPLPAVTAQPVPDQEAV